MATTTIKDGFNGGSDNQMKVNPDGSINVDVTGGGGGLTNVNITEVNGTPITGTYLPTTNPSIGPDGVTAPTYATEVGAVGPTGLLEPLMVDNTGALIVTSTGSGSPNVNLIEVGGAAISLGQTTESASLPVTIASNQSPIPVTIQGVNPNQNSVLIYNMVAAVAVGVTTTIATYTAPAAPTVACLLLVSVSGQNVGQWTITNSSAGVYDQNYTSAAALNEYFTFETGSSIVPGQIIGAGNTITVSVNQIGTAAANFNARIQVLEIG